MLILMMFIVGLIVLDILALLYGADSREGVECDPQTLGLLR